jgi:hypothetical protein
VIHVLLIARSSAIYANPCSHTGNRCQLVLDSRRVDDTKPTMESSRRRRVPWIGEDYRVLAATETGHLEPFGMQLPFGLALEVET